MLLAGGTVQAAEKDATTTSSASRQAAAEPSRRIARLPLFRHVDAALLKAHPPRPEQIRFLLADDLPPFTFRNSNGAITGLAVAVAQAICRRARLRCQFVVRPRRELLKALQAGRGDVIISGLRPTASAWRKADFTRPYFKALGQVAIRRDARIAGAFHEGLAGRRVAVVKGSVHALWLARHMGGVRILLMPDFAAATRELKEGRADALFADWLQLAFWVHGEDASGCCRLLPQLIPARLFAYNHLSMAVRAGARDLRDFLDRQLDLLQEDGELHILARRFLPLTMMPPARAADATQAGQAGSAEGGKEEGGKEREKTQ